jgi:integrase
MLDMAKRELPYLQIESRKSGSAYYVRMERRGPRIRIKGEFESDEFMKAYYAAVAGEKPPSKRGPKSGTLSWLIEQYTALSPKWKAYSKATKKQRENIFKHVKDDDEAGGMPFAGITKQDIIEGKERRSETPAQSRNFLDAMRGLFEWAAEKQHVTDNPVLGVKNPPRPKGEGFPVWFEDDVEKYERRWPVGTKERVWLDVLLYTGLRRGDAVRAGKQHMRNGVLILKTEKSGFAIEVTIPILPILQTTLTAGPTGDLTFIVGKAGKPFKKESFGNLFHDACKAAGIAKSAHGLRKLGATRAANNGATVAELEAIFGWEGGDMAALYTKAADRRRLSTGAIQKMVGNDR